MEAGIVGKRVEVVAAAGLIHWQCACWMALLCWAVVEGSGVGSSLM
jgi:hypothetical protein